jgi:hypothetical protein
LVLAFIEGKGTKDQSSVIMDFEYMAATDMWRVIRHVHTGERHRKGTNLVPNEDVSKLSDVIESMCKRRKGVRAREVWAAIIKDRQLNISEEEFSGNVCKGSHYYPMYYWPLKILEHKGIIAQSNKRISWNGKISIPYLKEARAIREQLHGQGA